MKVVFRTDASVTIGTGHVMRCLTLAEQLRTQGADVTFVCRELDGHQCDLIEQDGYHVCRLPFSERDTAGVGDGLYDRWLAVSMDHEASQVEKALKAIEGDIDWLIADHYALDAEWDRRMLPHVGRLMVIDDLADRNRRCDVLLDQNMYADDERRKSDLVPPDCVVLSGPRYALLRPEFGVARREMPVRDGKIRRLLVFFGGSDPSNETMKAIDAFGRLENRTVECDVIVGGANPYIDEIRRACDKDDKLHFHCQVSNMAELMVSADLALGAPGTTTWERCCVGLPSLLMAIAENQEPIGDGANKAGFARYLGVGGAVTVENLAYEIGKLNERPDVLMEMSRRGMELVDGMGGSRVGDCLCSSELKGIIH